MKKTYIGRVLVYEMQRCGLTQSALADRATIPQPTISQIIATDVRIAPTSLNALTHCWPTPEANGRVLIAHLRDEINRSGHDPDNSIEIRWPNGGRATTIAARSLAVIQSQLADPDVAALVHALATVLRRKERASARAAQPGLAADPQGPDYTT